MTMRIEELGMQQALQKIIDYEEKLEHEYATDPLFENDETDPYWKITDVPVEWKYVRRFLHAGMLEKMGKYYLLKDRDEAVSILEGSKHQNKKAMTKKVKTKKKTIPDDMFDIIEGYDDIKNYFDMALRASEPVHVLLVGPPATAKSLFLMELERLGGRFATAGTATKAGIRDVLFWELPEILLIDELDKIDNARDLSSLLTWMEDGRIIVTKHGMKEERKGDGYVFAAANRIERLPTELLDRFQVFHLREYTDDEFIRVVVGYLTKRRGVKKGLAKYIAMRTLEHSNSIRDAVRVSKLASTKKDVDEIVKIVRKYSE